jgi:hypothetical protein
MIGDLYQGTGFSRAVSIFVANAENLPIGRKAIAVETAARIGATAKFAYPSG